MYRMNEQEMKDFRQITTTLAENLKEAGLGKDSLPFQQACTLINLAIDVENRCIDPADKPEGPFEIMISEFQRVLLTRACDFFESHPQVRIELVNKPGEQFSSAFEELQTLKNMFEELPKENKDGMTHGFCL